MAKVNGNFLSAQYSFVILYEAQRLSWVLGESEFYCVNDERAR